MRFGAVIQARAGSTRLPGKAFLDLLPDRTLTECLLARVKRATQLDSVCLAIPRTGTRADWHFKEIADRVGVRVCCPLDTDENDLIARHLEAAAVCGLTHIVRIPGDNPCVDPAVIDAAITAYREGRHIYYTNTTAEVGGVWVDGLGAEVVSVDRLALVETLTRGQPAWREHPHLWFEQHLGVRPHEATVRVDVNTPPDFAFVQSLYQQFGHDHFTAKELLHVIRQQKSPEPAIRPE